MKLKANARGRLPHNDGSGLDETFDGGTVFTLDNTLGGATTGVEWWLWVEWCVVMGGGAVGGAVVLAKQWS